jgi:hypothetical protein
VHYLVDSGGSYRLEEPVGQRWLLIDQIISVEDDPTD